MPYILEGPVSWYTTCRLNQEMQICTKSMSPGRRCSSYKHNTGGKTTQNLPTCTDHDMPDIYNLSLHSHVFSMRYTKRSLPGLPQRRSGA